MSRSKLRPAVVILQGAAWSSNDVDRRDNLPRPSGVAVDTGSRVALKAEHASNTYNTISRPALDD